MAQKDTSVNLVIRARNEADRAINTVTSAVQNLLDTTEKGGSKVAALTKSLLDIDKAAGTISAAADRGEAAFNKLSQQIDTRRAELAGLQAEAKSAAEAIRNLNSGDAIVNAGRDQSARLAQLKTVEAAYDSLQAKIVRLSSTIAADEARLNNSRSALQQLGSTAIAAADGQARLRAEIELETQALTRQAAEAERVTAIQARINALTGVDRQATFDGNRAAQSAEILAEAAARDALTQKYRQQAAEARDLAAAEAAEAANRRRFGITEDPRGSQAAQSAAVFQQQARAAEEAARLRAELNPLAAIQKRYNDQIREAIALRRQELISTEELRARIEQLRAASARAQARAAEEAARSTTQQADAVARLRAELNPLAAIQKRYNDQIREAIALRRQELISTEELRARIEQLRAASARAQVDFKRNGGTGVGIFGLRPYEVTSLGYQVNDLVTQVASGTSVFQALAQQGGQILQILPQIGTNLLALARNPFFLLGAASVGALVLGLKAIGDQAERLRTFEATLTAIGNGANYNAAELEKAARAAQRYGTSAADATAALKTFVNEGIAEDKLAAFTRTAQNMADVLGVKVPDAAKQLAAGFTGGYDAIVKLDEATNFLTAAQREQIRTLFEEGRAQEARAEAYRIFADRQEDAAQKQRGPWTEAVRALSGAWQSFIDFLANNTVIQGTAKAVEGLAGAVTKLFRALDGSAGTVFNEIIEKQRQIVELQRKVAAEPLNQLYQVQLQDAQRGLETLKRQYEKAAGKPFEQAQATGTATGSGGDPLSGDPNTPEAKRRSDRLAEIERQRLLDRQKKLSDAQRVAQAGELAYREEIKKSGDAIIANAERALAISREQAKVDEENAREAAKRLREGATPLGAAKNLIMEREGFRARAYYDVNAYRVGYGSDTVTNPDGSVSRVTRNTTTTQEAALVDLERRIKEFQDGIKRLIGADRFNAFSPQQQAVLTSVAYNYGTLGSGPNGRGGAKIDNIVRTGTQEEIAAAIRALGSDNNGRNRGRRNREADLFAAAPNAELDAYNQQQAQKRLEQQQKFNQSLDDEISKRRLSADSLRVEGELTGNKLLDARKQREIEVALDEERKKARDAGIKADDEALQKRLENLRTALDAEFEARNRRQRQQNTVDEVQAPVDSFLSQRKSLQEQITFARQNGQTAEADALLPKLDQINAKLREAADNALAFYQALDPINNSLGLTAEQIESAIAKLKVARETTTEWGSILGVSAQQIAQAFASTLTSAFDKFAQSVDEGKNVFEAAKDAFLDFAASFLRLIAQMILQQLAFNLAKGILGSFGVPVGTNHTGGIAGRDRTETRIVSPMWFAAAARYHSGGVAGLRPDEVPAILQRGEEVITKNDPRHRDNGGLLPPPAPSGGGGSVKVVNVFDSGAAVEEALKTPAGEQAILNHVRNNQQSWRGALGVA